jgi:hypothetical protein
MGDNHMNQPRDGALIVEGPKPWGPPTEVVLGQVERRCLQCGRDWVDPRCACGSFEFSEKVVRATAMTITGMGISTVKEPPQPMVDALPADLESLRELRAALVQAERCLVSADGAARRLVNLNSTNVGVFGHLQSVLNSLTTPGDFQLRADVPLTSISLVPVLRALVAEIDRTLARYQEELPK